MHTRLFLPTSGLETRIVRTTMAVRILLQEIGAFDSAHCTIHGRKTVTHHIIPRHHCQQHSHHYQKKSISTSTSFFSKPTYLLLFLRSLSRAGHSEDMTYWRDVVEQISAFMKTAILLELDEAESSTYRRRWGWMGSLNSTNQCIRSWTKFSRFRPTDIFGAGRAV